MSSLQPSQIPDGVNTLEKLHVWSSLALLSINPNLTVIEVGGAVDRAILAQPWQITATDPATYRFISRASIQLNANWLRGGKIWTQALDLSATAIPSDFFSN